MDNPILEELRKAAINFKIEPAGTAGNAASVSDVIRVFSGIQESFRNFIKIEIKKSAEFKNEIGSNKNLINQVIAEMDLLIVDAKFSYQSSVVPDIAQNLSLFKNNTLSWKSRKFKEYKDRIIYSDINDINNLYSLSKKYTIKERELIFTPLFNASGNGKDYKVRVWEQDREKINLIKPKKLYETYFKSNKTKPVHKAERISEVVQKPVKEKE
ncbi:hypothetical protein MKJ01_17205 [Chryseobacterium sp. SSA4.19]|uniref:hypothetical protein n=1 Tax=Chryseobacterium sp. SSA4.19 TaxID=2919915 RepID=UPI001F4E17C9|nr:hypothetical protein [Chryseobacterium sp. SSA4.19]MCJ8155499.1 hypothetical protein [Chryseobacterium sp. SSA4.19]